MVQRVITVGNHFDGVDTVAAEAEVNSERQGTGENHHRNPRPCGEMRGNETFPLSKTVILKGIFFSAKMCKEYLSLLSLK